MRLFLLRRFLFLLLCHFCLTKIVAQEVIEKQIAKNISPLKVGQQIPDIKLGRVISKGVLFDSIGMIIKPSVFKGRLLILDFWSSSCASCIEQFPKLENLQHKFRDSIVILPVGLPRKRSSESNYGDIYDLVQKLDKANRKMKLASTEIEIPSGEDDSIFFKLLPFNSVPTIAWIGKDGMFLGLTEANAVTEKNIRDLLNGKDLNFRVKREQDFLNSDSPFLLKKIKGNQIQVYGSAFSNYNDSLRPSLLRIDTSDTHNYRFYAVNNSMYDLYVAAYRNLKSVNNWVTNKKRIIVIPDENATYKDRIHVKNADNWALDELYRKNYFCYELVLPRSSFSLEGAFMFMVSNLDAFFGIKSRIERKAVGCLVLNDVNNVTRRQANRVSRENNEACQSDVYQVKGNVERLINFLNTVLLFTDTPVILNNSKNKSEVDITFQKKEINLKSIESSLIINGFILTKSEKEMDVLVLEKLLNPK